MAKGVSAQAAEGDIWTKEGGSERRWQQTESCEGRFMVLPHAKYNSSDQITDNEGVRETFTGVWW